MCQTPQEEFEASQQRCSVCFEEQPGSSCVRLPGCRHHFCRGCLQQLCSTHVKEGSVEALRWAACVRALQWSTAHVQHFTPQRPR